MLPPISHTVRVITYYLLITFFISSCSPNSATAYPTYDPFAPIAGTSISPAPVQPGEIIQATKTPAGPTPTRAPISVKIPTRNASSSFTAPTPDAPHPLPPPREFIDQYTVQAGDTLGSIALSYGITLEALLQANGLNEASILAVGDVLNIPPIDVDPIPGSSFKIIPDS